MDILSSGEVFRDMAKENDMSLEEFSQLAEESEEIDKKLDENMIDRASRGSILEGRLTGHLLHKSDKRAYKVWMEAPLDTRVKRIADRENHQNIEELREKVVRREESEAKRYKEYYDIDISDTSFYDMIIDSVENSPEEIVDKIVEGVRDEICEE